MKRLALLTLLTGCAEPLPLVLSNGNVLDGELPRWAEDACDLLELGCVLEDAGSPRGSVMVFTTPKPQNGIAGQELIDGACRKAVWSMEGASRVLAHELGHVFGLDHVDDPDNLMAGEDPGERLTDEQLAQVFRSASRFVTGCP